MAVVAIAFVLLIAAGIVLSEAALRPPRHAIPERPPFQVNWRAAQITAQDGAILCGWLLLPPRSNGDVVIVLHGIADSRTGSAGLAPMFLDRGYTVLLPDSRGHGESGGELVTYGLRERDDVHRWVDWLIANQHPPHLFGMGESLGAAVLLQSLGLERRFNAVVAEAPFATFERVAVDRVAQRLPFNNGFARIVAWPMVYSGFLYSRLRYGLDFRSVSPENVIRTASTPVLLIHGLADTNIYPEHSREIAARNSRSVTLWQVPGATHTQAFAAGPEEFRSRVLGWFASHSGG
jgi:alpha-beta hydrolase superfamily lysophospholipase